MTPITCPACRTPLEVRNPEQVVAYLYREGWTSAGTMRDRGVVEWQSYQRRDDRVDVPMRSEFRDYRRCFLKLATNLSRLENRPIPVILADMAGPSVLDEVIASLEANATDVPDVEISQDLIDRLCNDDEGEPSAHCSGCGVRLGDSWCAACASTAEIERVKAALREALHGYEIAVEALGVETGTPWRQALARIAEWRKLVE